MEDKEYRLRILVDNDHPMYMAKVAAFRQLAKHKARGTYDKAMARKAFAFLMEQAAKKAEKEDAYHEERSERPWHEAFPKSARDEAAQVYADEFEVEWKLGHLLEELPAKYRGKSVQQLEAEATARPRRPKKPKRFTLAEIRKMPTLHSGHTDNVVYDDGTYRVHVSRLTIEDGMPYDHQVTVEKNERGAWREVEVYKPKGARETRASSHAQTMASIKAGRGARHAQVMRGMSGGSSGPNPYIEAAGRHRRGGNPLTKKEAARISHGSMSGEVAEAKLSESEEKLAGHLQHAEAFAGPTGNRREYGTAMRSAKRELEALTKLARYTMSEADSADYLRGWRAQYEMRAASGSAARHRSGDNPRIPGEAPLYQTTTVYLEDGTEVFAPDKMLPRIPEAVNLTPFRGSSHQLLARRGGKALGFVPVELTGHKTVREWMAARHKKGSNPLTKAEKERLRRQGRFQGREAAGFAEGSTIEELREEAHEGEQNARQYAGHPTYDITREFGAPERDEFDIEEAYDAYEEGVSVGIEQGLPQRIRELKVKGHWGGGNPMTRKVGPAGHPFAVGDTVRVAFGSGVLSGRVGTIVPPTEVRTDGRGIPTNIQGAYSPVNWREEVALRLDDGELVTMFVNRLAHAGDAHRRGENPMTKKERSRAGKKAAKTRAKKKAKRSKAAKKAAKTRAQKGRPTTTAADMKLKQRMRKLIPGGR